MARHLVLDGEHVLDFAVVAFRPQAVAGRSLDQLGGNAHPRAGLADAALEDVAHAQLAAHILDLHRPALVTEGRVSGDDDQFLKARELGDQVLGDPIGEVVLFGVATQVVERQDRKRGSMGLRISRWRRGAGGGPTFAHVKGAHRTGDVLERLFASRIVGETELVPDAVVYRAGHTDAAGHTHLLEARRDIDAVAVDVVARDHDVAEVDADAELQAPLLGLVGVAPLQIVLDLGGAGNRVGDRGELGQ